MSTTSEDYVYGHIIEAITGGLYPNQLDVIREYLQNSCDAIKEHVNNSKNDDERDDRISKSKIEVSIKGGSLFIHDNATGMDRALLNEYRKIGFSRKPYGEYAGWRGIGKAAGMSVAEKLIVTTSIGDGKVHYLVFDSIEMNRLIREYRERGENIRLNELITRFSTIETHEEETESFTTVELHKVKSDAQDLLDAKKIISHIALIAPVPFDPEFEYADEIVSRLESHLPEYLPINIFVGKTQVFKPYLHQWRDFKTDADFDKIDKPQFLPIYDESKELIAYCWYCMHSDRGQIKTKRIVHETEVEVCGLFYRIHDIRIGDHNLTRKSLWTTTPERSLWALGEIHIVDDSVEPTSDRNDFLDNLGRFRLYDECRVIAKEISGEAGTLSKESKAKEKIESSGIRMEELKTEVSEKKVPKPIVAQYIYEALKLKDEANKRKKDTKEDALKEKAEEIIESADKLVEILTDSIESDEEEKRVHIDIIDDLSLGEDAKYVYDIIINVLENYFSNEPKIYSDLVKRIDESLVDKLF